jgi:hypothetical protein
MPAGAPHRRHETAWASSSGSLMPALSRSSSRGRRHARRRRVFGSASSHIRGLACGHRRRSPSCCSRHRSVRRDPRRVDRRRDAASSPSPRVVRSGPRRTCTASCVAISPRQRRSIIGVQPVPDPVREAPAIRSSPPLPRRQLLRIAAEAHDDRLDGLLRHARSNDVATRVRKRQAADPARRSLLFVTPRATERAAATTPAPRRSCRACGMAARARRPGA